MKKLKTFLKLTLTGYLGVCCYDYYYKSSSLDIKYEFSKLKDVIELNPSLCCKKYYPSFFFPTGHVQTVLLLFMNGIEKSRKFLNYYKYSSTRKIVDARDGEAIYLDFSYKSKGIDQHPEDMHNFDFLKSYDNSKILFIVPGACGTGGEFYLTDVMEKFTQENYKIIAYNHRGVLNYKLKKNKLYHAGYTDDLHDAFNFLNTHIKNSKYFVLGFSMGGNVVTKFLGESGLKAKDTYNIYGGCSVCGPLDLKKFTEFTETNSFTKTYSKSYCNSLRGVYNKNKLELLREYSELEATEIDEKVQKSQVASDYYKNYIFKAFGYTSVEQYNKENSASTYLNDISVPCFCIFSKDDPIVPYDTLTIEQVKVNDNIILALSKSGGHVGFFKGLYLKRWIFYPILEFIRDLH